MATRYLPLEDFVMGIGHRRIRVVGVASGLGPGRRFSSKSRPEPDPKSVPANSGATGKMKRDRG